MNPSSTDSIRAQIEINAPIARVWRALTDHREFGAWFQVNLESPFVPGQRTRGRITYPGYEHIVMEVLVKEMAQDRTFSFYWHPYAVDPNVDYSKEEPTLVVFTLQAKGSGTLLTAVESGFDRIPAHRRDEAFRMNNAGWSEQMGNIQRHAERHP